MKKRKSKEKCRCTYLTRFAKDPSVPVEYDEESKKFFIILSESKKAEMNFCFFCGGEEIDPFKEATNKCLCNSVFEWTKIVSYPVKYNPKFEEYILVGDNKSKAIIYFCPICGGQMPKSKRGDFFTIMSEEEMNEVVSKIGDTKNIKGIVKIFGKPDKEFGAFGGDEARNEVFGLKNTKRTLLYKSVGKTLDLFVDEDEDGKIIYYFAGKMKQNKKAN